MKEPSLDWVEWNPTMLCQAPFANLQPEVAGEFRGCSYCYAAPGMPHTAAQAKEFLAKEVSTEEKREIVGIIAKLKIKRLSFLGGEPQSLKDFSEVVGLACDKIPLVSLTTNGAGTERHIETLMKVPIVEVSLDSNEREIAAKTRPPLVVESALRTVDLLRDHPFLCLSTVVSPFNVDHMRDFLDWAWTKGVKRVNLYPILGNTGSPESVSITDEQASELYEKLKLLYPVFGQNYCKAGKHVIVNPDGAVLACSAFLGTEVGVDSAARELESFLVSGLPSIFKKYDFKKIAPKGGIFSPGCPAKKLHDSDWMAPLIPLKREGSGETQESYCMRCNSKNTAESPSCEYCGFDHFDTESIMMMCSAFSVYNPNFFKQEALDSD